MSEFDELLRLPIEKQEQRWLRERLATLSVRESVALTAAMLRHPPENAADAINLLQSLDHYTVHINAGNYEALGHAWLHNETRMPQSALPFVDLEQTGRYYEDKHPGLFIGDCYVEYPKTAPQPAYHGQGTPLPEDTDWSVKLKIASDAVPEGVWLRLPGWEPCGDESSADEELALRELRTRNWNDCTLLDARCVLPQAGNLMEQYDNVADLIYDGINLGFILDEHGQGSPGFMERYIAALELEHCSTLRLALDISQNLHCYDWVAHADLEESARGLLLDAGVSEELIHACGIDLAGYKAHLLEEDGYTLSADGSYIRRNYEEFHYSYSTPTRSQSGMTMQ